ncbi:hypothetical protein C7212DRAFT_308153, partial [Tuber magnatum]
LSFFVALGASLLFDSVNHRTLLPVSTLFMAIFAAVPATGILSGMATLSGIATLLFVMSFSMIFGPLLDGGLP